jgi:glutamine synthetase
MSVKLKEHLESKIYMSTELALTNPVFKHIGKSKYDVTRNDLLKYIEEKGIERINFNYTALDGHIKELKIPVINKKQVERILADGERVDGSSLFKGLVDSGLSDLYVVPVYSTAFLNPFYKNSINFVCRYLNSEGKLAPFTPDNILINAYDKLKKETGYELHTFGELEFYIFNLRDSEMYTTPKQEGYHASAPFIKTGRVLSKILRTITPVTGSVKYGHSEVGYIERLESTDLDLKGRTGEQMEIEFLPAPAPESADNLVLAKWIIRNVSYRNNMLATFAPKLEEGDAGNGMHIHLALYKDGKNVMRDKSGKISAEGKKGIGGLCNFADSLTAFGNTLSSSYLRLVPHQEAPTRICWSDSNRSSLIRVPIGWSNINNLASAINPSQPADYKDDSGRQTVELRSPDGSGNIHLLMAGITVAINWGLTNEKALMLTDELYVKGNVFGNPDLLANLPALPSSCYASAQILKEKKALYLKDNIFSESIIDYVIELLEEENDIDLIYKLSKMSAVNRARVLREIMHSKIHRH